MTDLTALYTFTHWAPDDDDDDDDDDDGDDDDVHLHSAVTPGYCIMHAR